MDKQDLIYKIEKIRDQMVEESESEPGMFDGETGKAYVNDFANALIKYVNEESDAKTKYRIIYQVGYYTTVFQFDSIDKAGDFARELLTYQIPNEDCDKKQTIQIEMLQEIEKEG